MIHKVLFFLSNFIFLKVYNKFTKRSFYSKC